MTAVLDMLSLLFAVAIRRCGNAQWACYPEWWLYVLCRQNLVDMLIKGERQRSCLRLSFGHPEAPSGDFFSEGLGIAGIHNVIFH